MWPGGVVVLPPRFDQDLCLAQIEEDLPRQQLVAQLAVEAFAVAVFPWRARLNVERFYADPLKPFAQSCCNELWSVVGSYVLGCPVTNEQLAQRVKDIPGGELALDPDGEALACVLVDHAQHTEHSSIVGAVLYEVIGPDMAFVRRPQPHARAVIQPETAAFWLFHRYFQPLSPPDAVNPLLVHIPAVVPEQSCDPPVTVPAKPLGKASDRRCHGVFIVSPDVRLTLGRTMLADHAARPALSHAKLFHHMIDRSALAGGAQNFP